MNRHFQNYSALPCEPLGAPIRREDARPSPEAPWKPVPGHPDYRERINAQGVREVTHKDHVPAPIVGLTQAESAARGDSIVTTLADVPEGATHRGPGPSRQPDAPTEWQSGPPPERGWYDSYCFDCKDPVPPLCMSSFWNGSRWTHNTAVPNAHHVVDDNGWCCVWRGPRLTGADWPEPQQ